MVAKDQIRRSSTLAQRGSPCLVMMREKNRGRFRKREIAIFAQFTLTVGLVFRCVDAQETLPPDLRSSFLAGIEAQREGDFTRAAAKYRQVQGEVPGFVPAIFNLGLVLNEMSKFAEARNAFERVAAINPEYPNVHLLLGIEEVKLNDPKPALAALLLAVKENPRDKQGWFWTARAELLLHQPDAALRAAEKAEEIAPDDPGSQFLIASIHMERQEWQVSETLLKRLADSHPNEAQIMDALGMAYYQEARPVAAATEYQQVLDSRPEDGEAHAMLGRILSEQGRYREAEPHLRAALKSNPEVPELLVLLSESLWQEGQRQEAIRNAQVAEKLAPANARSHFLLWKLYSETKWADGAEEELKLFKEASQKVVDRASDSGFDKGVN